MITLLINTEFYNLHDDLLVDWGGAYKFIIYVYLVFVIVKLLMPARYNFVKQIVLYNI